MRHVILLAGLALAACNQGGQNAEVPAAQPDNAMTADDNAMMNADDANNAMGGETAGRAALAGPTGTAHGTATLTPTAGGMMLTVNGVALPAGEHGLHIHTTGKCEPPKFDSAGAHWNPTNKQHGRDNPQGAHAGDLANITAAADGAGSVTADLPGATLDGVFDADGSAILIHAKPDDYETDPSGNSGDRIACGVITAKAD